MTHWPPSAAHWSNSMTDEPYVGEFRWQGEPQNSPIELWDGKQWALVGGSEPTDEELWQLYDEMGGDPEDSAWCLSYARAVLDRWCK
jgi:hypothetical protein